MNGLGTGPSGNGHDKSGNGFHHPPAVTPLRNDPGAPLPGIPPNDQLEQLLLAALLNDNQRLADVGALKPEHFARDVHGRIFALIGRLIAQELPATPQTMSYMVQGDLALATETDYLGTLARSSVSYTPLAVQHYASELVALHHQRRLLELGNDLPRIFSDAKEHTYVPRTEAARHEFEQLFRNWQHDFPLPVPALDLTQLEEPEPQEWVVEDWLPIGETCAVAGTGGEGKTLLVQQLATAAALGGGAGAWVGLPVTGMKAALVLCEDRPADFQRRQAPINRFYRCANTDLADNLRVYTRRDADDNYLAVFDKDNQMQLTPFFHQLLTDLKQFGARLVVLDTLADVFCGDQNNPIHARRFVRGVCDRIARELNGTVILIYHPSIRGMKDHDLQYGNVQWNASFRARLVLTRPEADNDEEERTQDDDNTRCLGLIKANFAPISDGFEIVWDKGVFRRKPPPVSTVGYMASAIKARFIQLLDLFTQRGIPVSVSPRGNYAPRVFAADKEAKGATEKQLAVAMTQLLDDKVIAMQTPSGARSPRLVKVVE